MKSPQNCSPSSLLVSHISKLFLFSYPYTRNSPIAPNYDFSGKNHRSEFPRDTKGGWFCNSAAAAGLTKWQSIDCTRDFSNTADGLSARRLKSGLPSLLPHPSPHSPLSSPMRDYEPRLTRSYDSLIALIPCSLFAHPFWSSYLPRICEFHVILLSRSAFQ